MDCGFEEPEIKNEQTAKTNKAACSVPGHESASGLSLRLGPQHLPWHHLMQVLGQPAHSKALQIGVVDSDQDQTPSMRASVRPKSVFTPSLVQIQGTRLQGGWHGKERPDGAEELRGRILTRLIAAGEGSGPANCLACIRRMLKAFG